MAMKKIPKIWVNQKMAFLSLEFGIFVYNPYATHFTHLERTIIELLTFG